MKRKFLGFRGFNNCNLWQIFYHFYGKFNYHIQNINICSKTHNFTPTNTAVCIAFIAILRSAIIFKPLFESIFTLLWQLTEKNEFRVPTDGDGDKLHAISFEVKKKVGNIFLRHATACLCFFSEKIPGWRIHLFTTAHTILLCKYQILIAAQHCKMLFWCCAKNKTPGISRASSDMTQCRLKDKRKCVGCLAESLLVGAMHSVAANVFLFVIFRGLSRESWSIKRR